MYEYVLTMAREGQKQDKRLEWPLATTLAGAAAVVPRARELAHMQSPSQNNPIDWDRNQVEKAMAQLGALSPLDADEGLGAAATDVREQQVVRLLAEGPGVNEAERVERAALGVGRRVWLVRVRQVPGHVGSCFRTS